MHRAKQSYDSTGIAFRFVLFLQRHRWANEARELTSNDCGEELKIIQSGSDRYITSALELSNLIVSISGFRCACTPSTLWTWLMQPEFALSNMDWSCMRSLRVPAPSIVVDLALLPPLSNSCHRIGSSLP